MKKITIAEVKKYLIECIAEFEEETVDYYLHITEDGEIVCGASDANKSFIYSVPYERYGFDLKDIEEDESNAFCTIKDAIYDHEVDGDEIFEEIAKNLCDQANKWLEE